MKKINLFILLNIIFSVLFSVLNICFAADVSCLAFVLSGIYTAVILYFVGIKFAKEKNFNRLFASRKLMQYESFVFLIAFILRRAGAKGTAFAFDVVSVIIWLFLFGSASFLSYCFDFKRFEKITETKVNEVKNESIAKMFAKGKTRDGSKVTGLSYIRWFVFEVLDWADALVQAVFIVLLFQIFFFQFYKIPSESMVPEYMINDRVAVSKITSGPKFPLTDVGLPCLKTYNRGDIVVFRNPHYLIDRNSEVKTVVSQLIYMLTFTFVNTNLDEHGNVKADPLVKRITGVAGEQLMMQDGILYSRTKDSADFKPVEEDAKWAAYNLNSESPAVKSYIKDLVISEDIYQELLAVEKLRNEMNVSEMAENCKKIASQFKAIVPSKNPGVSEEDLINLFNSTDLFEYSVCTGYTNFAQALLTLSNGTEWFNAFMTDWISKYEGVLKGGYVGGNLYDDACYKLNICFKYYLGQLFVKTASNIKNGIPVNRWADDPEISRLEDNIRVLHNYICFMDRRNMPVFPANDESGNAQYIPENCYFMMGDNRFNSFDMRHTDNEYLTKLTNFDNYSITYYSSMKPMYVPKKLILGSTGIRFWPISRPVRSAK